MHEKERNRNQPDENSVWLGICLQVRQDGLRKDQCPTFWTPEQVPRLLDPSPGVTDDHTSDIPT